MWNFRRTREETRKDGVSNRRSEESKENSKNEFSKLQHMQWIGFLSAKLNPETLRFDRSFRGTLNCFLKLLLKASVVTKFYLSTLFEREDNTQIWIGNIFNFLPTLPKAFLGAVGLIAISWIFCLHFVYNYLNAKDDYRLFRKWAAITEELPAGKRPAVVGWNEEENQFWQNERRFNRFWKETMKWFCVVVCALFNYPMFLVPFDVNIYTYLIVMTIQVLTNSFGIFFYLHSLCTIDVFFATIALYFSKKFGYVEKQLANMRSESSKLTKKRFNLRLAEMIRSYNVVHQEMQEMDTFFRSFIGLCFLHYFFLVVLVVFVLILDVPAIVKPACILTMLGMYLCIVALPCLSANTVSYQIKRAKRQFENVAFCGHTSVANKLKIELISGLASETVGLHCFDWFILGTYTSFKITMEMLLLLLLILQTYFYLKFGVSRPDD